MPTQRQVAAAAGLGPTTVQQAEAGTGRISWETVEKVVRACWSIAEEGGQTPVRDLDRYEDLFGQLPESDRAEPARRRTEDAVDGAAAGSVRRRLRWPRARTSRWAVTAVAAVVLVSGTVAGLVLLTRPAPARPASPGCSTAQPCTYQAEVGEDLCLDQAVAYTPNRIELWVCWKGKNQRWIEDRHGDQFTLRTQESPAICVAAAAPGTQLTMGSCAARTALWTDTRNADRSYSFHSVAYRGLCLGAEGSVVHNRSAIVLQTCGHAYQQWIT